MEVGIAVNGETESAMPTMIQRTTTLLKDTPQLETIRRELLEGKGGHGGGGYVVYNVDLLWITSIREIPCLAIPRTLVPGVLALVHSTYAHPRVGITTALVNQRLYWPILARDVHDYVLSCGCCRQKRASSQRVAMLPARFLRPGEVFEIDTQGMGQRIKAGNRYLLIMADEASKFLIPATHQRGARHSEGAALT